MVEAGQYVTDGTVTWIVTDVRDGTQVGDIKLSPILRKGYVKANGALLTDASVNYPRLVTFAEENPLQKLYVYDSVNDTLTIPNYKEDNPIGSILSYMGNNVPTSYLSCDGTVYNIADYQELADFINNQFGSYNYFGGDGTTTFAVPDLRGEFLRGTGTATRNTGSGANVGVHQDPTYSRNFSLDQYNHLYAPVPAIYPGSVNWDTQYSFGSTSTMFNRFVTVADGIQTAQGSHYTSRPTNTSVLYCIKYTNPLIAQIKY